MPFQFKNNAKYRPEIDGLRAFAVLAVIINHFNKNLLPSGYLGVDIFFVISGYVITSSLAKRKSDNFKDFIFGFYERRIKRLIPNLTFFLLVIGILICFFDPDPKFSLRTGISSFFGLSNLYLLKQSTQYFAESTQLNVFTHTWSLGVEEQFYIFFPLIVWSSGFNRQTKNGARNLFISILFLVICSLIYFVSLYFNNQPAAYFLMPSRFWEMATGCLLFLLMQKKLYLLVYLEKISPNLIFLIMVSLLFLPSLSFGVISTILIVFFSGLLIINLKKGTYIFNLFTSNIFIHLGLLSYSLYLWHWGILSLSRWTIGIYWWSVPFQILLIYSFAYASYKYIETPFRKKDWSFNKSNIFTNILPIFLISFTSLITLERFPKNKIYLGNFYESTHDDLSPYISSTRIKCNNFELLSNDCITQGNKGNKKKLFLMGESHAGHIIPLIGEVHNETGIGVLTSTSNFYPVLNQSTNYGISLEGSIVRKKKVEKVFNQFFNKLNEGDILLLSSRLEHHLFEDFYNLEHQNRRRKFYSDNGNIISSDEALDLYSSKLEELINRAYKRNINIIIFGPIPVFRGLSEPTYKKNCNPEWFRPFLSEECKIKNFEEKKAEILKRVSPIKNLLYSFDRKYSNFYLYDIFDLLCPDDTCKTNIGEKNIYRDDDHFSLEGALYIKDHFINFLLSNNLLTRKLSK